jgi:endonuclease/exonuclease/phosphatase (EEP) superfamily protein YafD
MPVPTSRALSRARTWVLPVATGGLALAAFVRLVAPQANSATLILTGLTQWAFLPAYPLAVVSAIGKRWISLALGVAVVGAHVAWIAPEVFNTTAIPSGAHLRVATANLYAFNSRRSALAGGLEHARADVLVLEELTPSLAEQLRRHGLFAKYPYRFLRTEQNPQGIGILSTLPLTSAVEVPVGPARALRATVEMHGRAVELWAVHTHAPTRGEGRGLWNSEFQALRRIVADDGRQAIVAGDFNATMQYPSLLGFAGHAHLTEANRARGQGLLSTWPANRPFPPLMRVDHVFVRGLGVAGVHTFGIPGSDHRGVVAELVLPTVSSVVSAAPRLPMVDSTPPSPSTINTIGGTHVTSADHAFNASNKKATPRLKNNNPPRSDTVSRS